jgi:hypothetical protein
VDCPEFSGVGRKVCVCSALRMQAACAPPNRRRPAADLGSWLLPHTIENDRLAHLAWLVVEECRRRRIVIPSPGAPGRLCIQARYRARREVQRRLTNGLSAEQRHRLKALTQRRVATNQSWLTWLRQMLLTSLKSDPDYHRTAGPRPRRGLRFQYI